MVSYTNRIIIFALARTASTSIMNMLNVHKSIYAISEPLNVLNKDFIMELGFEGICEKEISKFSELDEALGKIFLQFNLVKHVWHPSGFPFIESDPGYAFNKTFSINDYLLSKFDFVVFLKRRNILKRLVSSLMSMQSGIWDSYTTEVSRKPEEFTYKPLNTEVIEWHLKNERVYEDYFRNTLKSNKVKYVEIFQEDIYNSNLSAEEKFQKFFDLSDFLELPRNYNHDQTMVLGDYLYSKKHKQNSLESYKKVPNIEEIEETFGSEETGWIFKKDS